MDQCITQPSSEKLLPALDSNTETLNWSMFRDKRLWNAQPKVEWTYHTALTKSQNTLRKRR